MPSYDELFVNDDLNNSPENRLNHVLFGLFLKDEYREQILSRLEIFEDAIIYKPTDRPWGGRPDFAIESYDGETIGYIEVELDKNQQQLDDYRGKAGVPVYSFGRAKKDHEITLQQLVEIGEAMLDEDPAPQFNLMVKHLAKQVKESSRVRHGGTVRPIGDCQLETPLGKALVTAGMVNWGTDAAFRPGRFYGRASGPNGISARVFSSKSSDRTISLFYVTGGRAVVNFVNYTRLIDYLPNKQTEIDEWADFIEQHFGGSIRNLPTKQNCPVKLSLVEAHVDDMLRVMSRLT